MKRKRAAEMESEMRSATAQLSVDHAAPDIPTKPFLSLCYVILRFLDKVGPTMAVLRQDIHQNIQRLESVYESDPLLYSNMVEVLKKEMNDGIARNLTSCSRAFLWLTRSLDFTVALLEKSREEPRLSMEQAVEDAYNLTLKPWHGWISSAAVKIALKLVPDSERFDRLLTANDERNDTLVEEIDSFISQLSPFLEHIHSILVNPSIPFSTIINFMTVNQPRVFLCVFSQRLYRLDRLKSA
ncbi:glycolipid transfer protein 3-like isoform X1 [Cucurbita moschata]|uniref:Glycolipid transfer protein 3-like isoform X1 n=1 Tax=Cucurbita moschata TaxID=3662 RepID=A0A6J1E660_CUCMO|nr:glycolipid transfer protein 3-like isoform X1 [Cucurbita moschata]